jgi:hypothetical protein
MFTQLNPPIPMFVPERDENGLAYGVIDYGIDHSLTWVVFLNRTAEIWCLPNSRVRGIENITAGRPATKDAGVDA